MKTYSNNLQRKLDTKAKIRWFLQVGYQYGTVTGEQQIIEILKIDRVTLYRWMNGKAAAPYSALELLRLHAFGLPPGKRSSDWSGFRFFNNQLITEDGRELSPGDLKAVFFWKQLALSHMDNEYKKIVYSELRKLKASG